jgi:predicted Rossmann fold nucleotide-binding protein DprA/Smf involved in DNA uptake
VDDILEEILPQAGIPAADPERSGFFPERTPRQDEPTTAPSSPSADAGALGDIEAKLLSFITQEPVDTDTLIVRSGFSAHQVQSSLLVLALKGIIRQLPGKQYIRKE